MRFFVIGGYAMAHHGLVRATNGVEVLIATTTQTWRVCARNGMIGADCSSKLSPWLSLGCLSSRQVFLEVKRYERERVENESTFWLTFELLWRDDFAFIAATHGTRLFRRSGLRGIEVPWKQDHARFDLWCRGATGFPLVDANMRELRATGFISNRGRQNVGSFLTKNLGFDWRWGAEWFESLLVDYDVASNWGNWSYTAGVGNDARGFRYFNIAKQSRDDDLQGDDVKLWLPELAAVPADRVHEPSTLTSADQTRFGVRISVDYARPVVDLFESARGEQGALRRRDVVACSTAVPRTEVELRHRLAVR